MTEPPRKPWAPGFVSVCILSFFLFFLCDILHVYHCAWLLVIKPRTRGSIATIDRPLYRY